jgi:ABC-type transport system substrate-binding protein
MVLDIKGHGFPRRHADGRRGGQVQPRPRPSTDARSNIKADLQNVAQADVTGPLQVTVKLARPDTALPAILSDRAGMMASPKAVQALGNEHDRKPVGAGPWKFVSWSANEKIVVTRADKYWRQDRGMPSTASSFPSSPSWPPACARWWPARTTLPTRCRRG